MSRGRKYGFIGFAIIVAMAFIRLGFWQLGRLEERRNLNSQIELSMAKPILTVREFEDLKKLEPYQQVEIFGAFDPANEILQTSIARNGLAGNHLITPLIFVEGGEAILIDRGWIPIEHGSLEARARYIVQDELAIRGMVFPTQPPARFSLDASDPGTLDQPDETWSSIHIEGIQNQVPYELADVYIIQSEPIDTSDEQPIAELLIDLNEGPHLGYAIQWFAFAAIAIAGIGIWVYRIP